MTQAKIIQSIIAGHQARYSQGEMYRKEAIKWSQLSGNPTIMAAALMYLGMTYVYYSPRKPQQGIDKLIEALHVLGNRPSILVSVIYITLANAYSQQAKEQETLSSLALAKENYPKHPQHDLSFLLADCSIQSLRDREGSALNKLASRLGNKEYYAKADTVLTESLTADRVPRGRIDAIRNKANAALGLGNLDLYVAHAEESILLAVSTESKWSYTKAQGIHEHIPQQWRHEQAIRDLEGVFDSVRKSLFSSEQTK